MGGLLDFFALIGMLLMFGGALMGVIAIFKENMLYGIIGLVFPPSLILLSLLNLIEWETVKKPIYIMCTGIAIFVLFST